MGVDWELNNRCDGKQIVQETNVWLAEFFQPGILPVWIGEIGMRKNFHNN